MILRTFTIILSLCISHTAIANTIFVNPTSNTGLDNGTSWQNAYLDLHTGLENSTVNDSIWIAEGIYLTTLSNNQTISFNLPEGVSIFGGFVGSETELSQRELETHFTILTGEIGDENTTLDNAFTVLSLEIVTGSFNEINGLIIEKGLAIPPSLSCLDCTDEASCHGGGLFVSVEENENLSSLIIRNSKFKENGGLAGNGLYINAHGALNIDIEDCVFIENYYYIASCAPEEGGGGAYVIQRELNNYQQEINITNCIFEQNDSNTTGGGGLYYRQIGEDEMKPHLNISSTQFKNNNITGKSASGSGLYLSCFADHLGDINIENCNFQSNSAGFGIDSGVGGGATIVCGGAGVLLENCIFKDNIGQLGGGIFSLGKITASGCTFSNNGAMEGGGISINGDLFLANSLFYNNSVTGNGGAIRAFGYLSLFNSLFYDNSATETGGGIYNLSWGANYSNSTFYNNHSDNGGAALTFGGLNSTLSNCIFWDNKSTNTDFNIIEGGGDTLTLSSCIFDTPDCESVTGFLFNDVLNCEGNTFFNEYPEFRDTANLDFSLISCSIGVNAGSDIPDIFSDIDTDIAGNPRILDGVPDIGAYEIKGIETFATISDATGANNEDGQIEIDSIIGGISPYEILWSNNIEETLNGNLLQGNYEVTITDSVGCTYLTSYEVSFTSAMSDIERKNYSLSPNPAKEFCTFSWSNNYPNKWNIKVLDIHGKLIFTQFNLMQQSVNIDVSDYQAGVYIISVEENGHVLNEKFTKL